MKFEPSGRSRKLAALCSLILGMQLAGCGGSDNDNPPPSAQTPPPSSPPPTGNPPPPSSPPVAKVRLALAGKVTDEPIPNAQVTAVVGAETFSATADALGAYTLNIEIDETNVDAFVTLTARGVGDQSYVEFKSLAGSFQSLVTDAGSDGTLASNENFATQITNVSTAQAVFMELANEGQPITSDSALQAAASKVNAQDMLDLAAAIKLVVDDPANNPMPAGQTSILALASDPAARQSFVNEVYENNPEAFAAAQVAIAQDPELAQNDGTLQRYLDNEGFTSAMLSTDALFTFNYSGRVSHFDLRPDGTGSESTDSYDQAFTWQLDGSSIEITYNEPVEVVSYDTVNCNGSVEQRQGNYEANGATLTFLNERTVAITQTNMVTYPGCTGLDGERTTTAARTVLDLDNFQVIDVAEIFGNAQTIYVWNGAEVVADVAELNANGTGRALITGQDFTWELEDEGKLIAAQFSGWKGEYLSFRDIDQLASDIFWEVRIGVDGEGGVYMGAGASVFADPEYAVTVTEADVVGTFHQFGVGEEGVDDERLGGFRLRFDEGGTGAQLLDVIGLDGNVQNNSDPFRWEIDETGPVGVEVVVTRTLHWPSDTPDCELGTTDCILIDERRIIPIVADDDRSPARMYWLEVRRTAPPGGVVGDTPATHLVRFYDFEPAADAPLVTKLRADVSLPRKLLDGAKQR